MTLLIFLLS